MSAEAKSAYVIETSVGPGGSRWAEIHAYNDKSHIEAVLRSFCENRSMEAYHAIWYGADLYAYAVQRGAVTVAIDLHRHLYAKIGSSPSVRLDDEAALRAMILASVRAARESDDELDEDDNDEALWDDLGDWDVFDRVELFVDWPAIDALLPALEAPWLGPGQRTPLACALSNVGAYLTLSQTLRFGSEDRETGVRLSPPPGVETPEPNDDDED